MGSAASSEAAPLAPGSPPPGEAGNALNGASPESSPATEDPRSITPKPVLKGRRERSAAERDVVEFMQPSTLPESFFAQHTTYKTLVAAMVEVLGEPEERAKLHVFLKTELSEELLDFLGESDTFTAMQALAAQMVEGEAAAGTAPAAAAGSPARPGAPPQNARDACERALGFADALYKQYVAPGSEYDVNVPHKTKIRLKRRLEALRKEAAKAGEEGGAASAAGCVLPDAELFDEVTSEVIDELITND